ncbi:MAG: PD-(D/E)XK nuclease family protein [Lactobacillales bacterium]|nr:PD-(D/E)XK nuclease family protein [Lactobacillales bacterium]
MASIKDWEQAAVKWISGVLSKEVVLAKETRVQTKNFMDLLMMTLIRHKDADVLEPGENVRNNLQIKEHPARFSLTRVTDDELREKRLQMLTSEIAELKVGAEKIQEYVEEIKIAKQRLDFHYLYVKATKTATYQSVSELKRVFAEPDNEQFAKLEWIEETKKVQHRFVSDQLSVPKFLSQLNTRKVNQAEIGTAMHLLLQTVDLTVKPTKESFLQLLTHFIDKGVIAQQVAEKVNVNLLTRLFETKFGKMLLAYPERVYREEPFLMLLSPSKIYAHYPEADDKVLIHGIVDGYLDFGEEVLLFDYKTDYLPFNPSAKEVKTIQKRYLEQMNLYKLALENALQKKVSEVKLILLKAGLVVDV